jgi:hypothetical protein
MFWNDIAEMKEWMSGLTDRLVRIDETIASHSHRLVKIDHSFESIRGKIEEKSHVCEIREDIKQCLEEEFFSEDYFNPINKIHDKLDSLIKDTDRQKAVLLAEKTLDKFEDYMKNVDKLNSMINEFKGCVSIARSAIAERKQLDEDVKEMKKVSDISQKIHRSMLSFIKAGDELQERGYFKLDAIYKAICEPNEKKSRKPCKKVKNKAVFSNSDS